MADPMKKAGVYARVSTEDQADKGYSLESQVEGCVNRALSLGYEEEQVAVFTDDVTGTTADRPGLNALREWCEGDNPPETVIVFDPDRLARRLSLQLMLTDELLKRGIRLEFVNFEWNNTPEGRMFYQLRGMFAEFEREKIRERTIRGKLTKLKATGKLSGDPRLYGYRFDTERDILLVDPETAEVVKRIFQLASRGCSGEEIARRLASEDVPAPRGNRWHGSTVTRILHNRSYLGEYKAYKTDYHQGYKRKRPESEQFPLPIEPLVSEQLFSEAQRTLKRNRTRAGRPAKREVLLTGIARCLCGRSMVIGGMSSGRNYAYYICSSKLKSAYSVAGGGDEDADGTGLYDAPCGNSYWNSVAADEAVWQELVRFLVAARSAWIPYLVRGRVPELNTEGMYAKERLQDTEGKLAKLVELYLSDRISGQLYDEKRAMLKRDADRWRGIIARTELCASENSTSVGGGDPWVLSDERTESHLSELPFPMRKQIVSLLVEKVLFRPDRALQLHFRLYEKPCDGQSHGGL